MKKIILVVSLISVFLLFVGCAKEVPVDVTPAPVKQEPVVQEEPKAAPEPEESKAAEPQVSVNTIKIVGNNFEPAEVTIKAGDKVVWENTRSGMLEKAMIKGTKKCVFLKSPIFLGGETFEWTFTEPGTCEFIDAITSIKVGKVIVE